MKTEHTVIRQYLGEVKDRMDCPRSVRTDFLKELKRDISRFAAQQPNMTREVLCDRFGTPQEIAESFYDRQEAGLRLQRLRNSAHRWRFIGILAFAAILLICALVLLIAHISAIPVTATNPY